MHKNLELDRSHGSEHAGGGGHDFKNPRREWALFRKPESPERQQAQHLNVVVFAGGRGAAEIISALDRHSEIRVQVLVNAYDDGLSTGDLRRYIPGLLGPSDVRKNTSRLMNPNQEHLKALQELVEYRFPVGLGNEEGQKILADIAAGQINHLQGSLKQWLLDLNMRQFEQLKCYLLRLLDYQSGPGSRLAPLTMSDCSFGNLLFAGCFLENGNDFNRTIDAFNKFCEIKQTVMNVTKGENFVLMALKKDGQFLSRESEIVSKQSDTAIEDIYLFPRYFTDEELNRINAMDFKSKKEFFAKNEVFPELGPEARLAIEDADVIIYGPGTQHSSLFPSYFTRDLGRAIAANTKAEKIFISNITKDHEIRSETVESLVSKLFYYLQQKNQQPIDTNDLVSRFFFQKYSDAVGSTSSNQLYFNVQNLPSARADIVVSNWQQGEGKHSGGQVVDEIVAIANQKLDRKFRNFPHKVSIVVPGLDEERTINKVLRDLVRIDFHRQGLHKEIIFVDGGSKDKTYDLARQIDGVDSHVLPATKGRGRGAALKYGFELATGSIIVTFPSDDEYDVNDIFPLVQSIATGEYQVSFGSRATKCVNLSDRIQYIYRKDTLGYLVSKYGGILLSVISLFFLNRFVSDILTGVKAFDSRYLKSLKLQSDGVDLEVELVAKIGRRQTYILELPVNYSPRTKKEGKKIRMSDGFSCLLAFVRFGFSRNHENGVSN